MMPMLIEAAARATGLALVVWLALALSRARNPHLQKSVWTAVLLASLAMPFLMHTTAAPIVQEPAYVLTLQSRASAGLQLRQAGLGLEALYGVIVVILVSHFAVSLRRMWRIRRDARPLSDGWVGNTDVRVSDALRSPATFGRTILLPPEFSAWNADKLHAVLSHERSHVGEWDCYVLWLARLHACVFWFNPMAWWIRRRLAALAEATSDDAALHVVEDRPGYAQILLEFAQRGGAGGTAVSMSRQNVSARIERILHGTGPATIPKRSRRVLAAAALLPACAAIAALQFAPARVGRADTPAPSAGSDATAAPHITSYGGLAELAKYYPAEAKRRGIEGMVRLAVTLDRFGHATDTLILSEDPPDEGFGAAASAAAHTMEFSNPSGRSVQFVFNVKFALDDDAHTTTNGGDTAGPDQR
jgi:TonB family protein